jgi:hypothetical protein
MPAIAVSAQSTNSKRSRRIKPSRGIQRRMTC